MSRPSPILGEMQSSTSRRLLLFRSGIESLKSSSWPSLRFSTSSRSCRFLFSVFTPASLSPAFSTETQHSSRYHTSSKQTHSRGSASSPFGLATLFSLLVFADSQCCLHSSALLVFTISDTMSQNWSTWRGMSSIALRNHTKITYRIYCNT